MEIAIESLHTMAIESGQPHTPEHEAATTPRGESLSQDVQQGIASMPPSREEALRSLTPRQQEILNLVGEGGIGETDVNDALEEFVVLSTVQKEIRTLRKLGLVKRVNEFDEEKGFRRAKVYLVTPETASAGQNEQQVFPKKK
jgi:DNA-binding NarL/FixJ family response regulator